MEEKAICNSTKMIDGGKNWRIHNLDKRICEEMYSGYEFQLDRIPASVGRCRAKEDETMWGIMKSELRKVRDLQRVSVEKSPDDYSVGIYNGLELALSICEKREPVFMFPEQSKSSISVIEGHEEKEQLGRTVAKGKRVIGNV